MTANLADDFFSMAPTFRTKERLNQMFNAHTDNQYLKHFHYDDWDMGDDDVLRLGDYINCNHQRPHDGYEQNFEGQLVAHHANGLPVVLYNIDPDEPENSGEYVDLQSLMMDCWTFTRIQKLTPKEVI